jgi:hypothetical protein
MEGESVAYEIAVAARDYWDSPIHEEVDLRLRKYFGNRLDDVIEYKEGDSK